MTMTQTVFKVITAGDGGVGKTTLLHKYITDIFLSDTNMTIGVQLHMKQVDFEGKKYTLQLWDLGGQDRFEFILPRYVNGSKGAMLVFNLTRLPTTFNLETSWLPLVRKENPDLPVILVGTKKDLVSPSLPMIDPTIPTNFVKEHHLQGYVEVSAETGENVEKAFNLILNAIIGNKSS